MQAGRDNHRSDFQSQEPAITAILPRLPPGDLARGDAV